jgi:tetratricopeptide (TPR) repeat protein
MSSTAKTYHLAFEGMAERFPISTDIFRLFAFLHPEEIPIEILTEGAQNIADAKLSETVSSPIKLSNALMGMVSGSLAQRLGDNTAKKFWIHDLVQYLFRQWMTYDEQLEWAERAIDVVNSVYPHALDSFETWKMAKIYLKHGLSCAERSGNLGIQTANLCDLMIRMSWFLRQTGDLTTAVGLANRAASCARLLEEGTARHMDSLSNLGLINYHLSRFAEAQKQWIEALQIAKSLHGSAYVDTGIGNNLALLYYQQGSFKDAEGHHLDIYLRRREVLGEFHPETLGAMGSLANTYHFQGRLEEAVNMKKRILEGRRKHMGEDHPETLGAQGSLATSYSDQGLHREAEQLQYAVMVGRHDQWGSKNPEYLSAKAALSYTFYLQGRLKEAERDQKEVLDERRKLFGDNHIETIGAMRFLAKTYYTQNRFDKAAELQENVVFQIEKLMGKDHPETLTAREEMSKTYNSQGLDEGARKLHEKVLTTRNSLWGTEGVHTLRSMESWSRKHQGFAH